MDAEPLSDATFFNGNDAKGGSSGISFRDLVARERLHGPGKA